MRRRNTAAVSGLTLNESPSEKEGKYRLIAIQHPMYAPPSMKVPPKRKGNFMTGEIHVRANNTLNESPSEKEGK